MNFNKYYDSFGVPSGARAVEFAAFSSKAIDAANAGIAEFLRSMPEEEVQQARRVARAAGLQLP